MTFFVAALAILAVSFVVMVAALSVMAVFD